MLHKKAARPGYQAGLNPLRWGLWKKSPFGGGRVIFPQKWDRKLHWSYTFNVTP